MSFSYAFAVTLRQVAPFLRVLSPWKSLWPLWLGLPVLVALRGGSQGGQPLLYPSLLLSNCLAMQKIHIGSQLTLEYGLIY